MNGQELNEWKYDGFRKMMKERYGFINRHSIEVDGVTFVLLEYALSFSFFNASGLVHPDHRFLRVGEYKPAVRLSCRYSDDCRFNPVCDPDLASIAAAVKASWAAFTGR